uniref:Gla domain-containing protein n=1 Tax=Podarcis muralis TaxID=64176 RepID=A0A670JKI3_PODMU
MRTTAKITLLVQKHAVRELPSVPEGERELQRDPRERPGIGRGSPSSGEGNQFSSSGEGGQMGESERRRKPLYNHWDFELFTPGNLQRECIEEICNYEEMREVFEDDFQTAEYGESLGLGKRPGVDVAGLVAGLVGALVSVDCFVTCSHHSDSSPSLIRAQSDLYPAVPLATFVEEPKPESAPGLPTYDQVLETSGVHDAPPPPYHRYKSF